MYFINTPLMRAKVDWKVSWWIRGKRCYQLLNKILDKLIMVKRCNGVTKYDFTLVWCYGETHAGSHGEMLKHSDEIM